jgi:hypothetical protein
MNVRALHLYLLGSLVGLSAVFLSGCGGGNDDGDAATTSEPGEAGTAASSGRGSSSGSR